jgi:hypothetical protein
MVELLIILQTNWVLLQFYYLMSFLDGVKVTIGDHSDSEITVSNNPIISDISWNFGGKLPNHNTTPAGSPAYSLAALCCSQTDSLHS